MKGLKHQLRLDTVSIAGIAVFSALATLLAAVSQGLGLNFPIVPYLQFDLGEVAIVTSFFIFGPLPAFLASIVEASALEVFGQNLPYGPALKLFALLSSIAGMWFGTGLATRIPNAGLRRIVGSSLLVGATIRSAVLTVANYYLIIFIFTLAGVVGFLKGSFALVGIMMTDANALFLILGFTAVFNVLQLTFALLISYSILRVSQVSSLKVGGKAPWIVTVARAGRGAKSMGE